MISDFSSFKSVKGNLEDAFAPLEDESYVKEVQIFYGNDIPQSVDRSKFGWAKKNIYISVSHTINKHNIFHLQTLDQIKNSSTTFKDMSSLMECVYEALIKSKIEHDTIQIITNIGETGIYISLL